GALELREILDDQPERDPEPAGEPDVALHGVHASEMRELIEQQEDPLLRLAWRARRRPKGAGDQQTEPSGVGVNTVRGQYQVHTHGLTLELGEIDGRPLQDLRHAQAVQEMRVALSGRYHAGALLWGL